MFNNFHSTPQQQQSTAARHTEASTTSMANNLSFIASLLFSNISFDQLDINNNTNSLLWSSPQQQQQQDDEDQQHCGSPQLFDISYLTSGSASQWSSGCNSPLNLSADVSDDSSWSPLASPTLFSCVDESTYHHQHTNAPKTAPQSALNSSTSLSSSHSSSSSASASSESSSPVARVGRAIVKTNQFGISSSSDAKSTSRHERSSSDGEKSDGLLRKVNNNNNNNNNTSVSNRKEEDRESGGNKQRRAKKSSAASASDRFDIYSDDRGTEKKKSATAPQRPLPTRSDNIDPIEFSKACTLVEQQKSRAGLSCGGGNGSSSSSSAASQLHKCRFCEKNGEREEIYMSHPLKDSLGKVVCPVLRNHKCPKCKESGDYAHTIKYCPDTQRKQKESKIAQCVNDLATTNNNNGRKI